MYDFTMLTVVPMRIDSRRSPGRDTSAGYSTLTFEPRLSFFEITRNLRVAGAIRTSFFAPRFSFFSYTAD
jgi:hypothetical protein